MFCLEPALSPFIQESFREAEPMRVGGGWVKSRVGRGKFKRGVGEYEGEVILSKFKSGTISELILAAARILPIKVNFHQTWYSR